MTITCNVVGCARAATSIIYPRWTWEALARTRSATLIAHVCPSHEHEHTLGRDLRFPSP